MEDYKKRVIEEKKELDIKVSALQKFIESNATFKTLNNYEQRDLRNQHGAMEEYSTILQRRINRF